MTKPWINNEQILFTLTTTFLSIFLSMISIIEMAIIPTQQRQNNFKLIVFSFDGFRPDYVDIERTPNLYAIAKNGVQGEMHSIFVTKTYPNHQSIVTGLYQPYHGIVNNIFIDNIKNKQLFNVNNDTIYWWDQNNISVPIYIANQLYEPNRYSISIQWPGSISNYSDGHNFDHRERVHYLLNYDANADWFHMIDILMKWLTDPEKPANVAFVYYPEPDSHAHQYGPFSDEVYDQVRKLDKVVGYFRKQLLDKHLAHMTNVIYLSDHGMAEIRSDRSLYIDRCDDYYPGLKYELYGSSPVWSAIPISAPKSINNADDDNVKLDKLVCDALNDCSKRYYENKFHCHLQKNINEQYHYKNNERILPLFIDADEGYDINYKDQGWRPKGYPIWGNHGYNASLRSMHALFLAQGPRFKIAYRHPITFENIDLYPLMLNLLGIPQKRFPPTNGTFERVHQMLSNHLYLNDDEFTLNIYDMLNNDSDNLDNNKWTLLFLYILIGFLFIFIAGFCFVCISGRVEKNYLRNTSGDTSTTSRLRNYLRKISYSHNNIDNNEQYRMFANERPLSHLDSTDDDDELSDDNADELYDRNNIGQQQQQQKSSIKRNQLTDIDWDILGTGLDIDLASQLNDNDKINNNKIKRNDYIDDDHIDNNHIDDESTAKTTTTARNEAVLLLNSNDNNSDDDDDNDNDEISNNKNKNKNKLIDI